MYRDVTTTVLAPAIALSSGAGPYDLVDIDTLKDELRVTDTAEDRRLQRAITQASVAVANYCNRTFQVEGVQDLVFLRRPRGVAPSWGMAPQRGEHRLKLSRWPLAPTFLGNTHTSTTVDGISAAAIAVLIAGLPISGAGIPAGTTIQSINVSAKSLALSLAATATATGVTLTTGVSVTEVAGDSTSTALVQDTDFRLDARNGMLIRLDSTTGLPIAWTGLQETVQYCAGYSAVPDDVAMATLRLATGRFRAMGRDPMLRSEGEPGLGQQTYWVGTAPGQDGSLPPEIAALIDDNYRVPVQ